MSLNLMISSSICVVTKERISFFFMAEEYSIVNKYNVFFIHWSVHRPFSCFYDLVIVSTAAVNEGEPMAPSPTKKMVFHSL